MAEAKTNFIDDALPDNVDLYQRDRLLRCAQLVQDQGKLRQCVEILKQRYDEKKLVQRLLRLMTQIVLKQMYPGRWKVMYNRLHLNGGEFVLNIEMEPYVWMNNKFSKLTQLYEGMLRHECDREKMNEFMQKLVNELTDGNIRNLKLNKRDIISKIRDGNSIDDIVGEYIPSE